MSTMTRDWKSGLKHQDETNEATDSIHPSGTSFEKDGVTLEDPHFSELRSNEVRPSRFPADQKSLAVEDFIVSITSIVESDYGDWMRRAFASYEELVHALRGSSDEVVKLMEEMGREIQFNPTWRIVETERKVVQIAERVRQVLGSQTVHRPEDHGVSETSVSEDFKSVKGLEPHAAIHFAPYIDYGYPNRTSEFGSHFENA